MQCKIFNSRTINFNMSSKTEYEYLTKGGTVSEKKTETIYTKRSLSKEERIERTGKLSELIDYKDQLEGDLKSFKAKNKNDTEQTEKGIKKLAQDIKNGFEYANVKCSVEYDYESKMKIYSSIEDGECLRKEYMTEKELQMQWDEAVNG